jgi:hypothetical protein
MPLFLDSITDADASAKGAVVISGSHGGLYPGAVASQAGVGAAIFNDAGIGKDEAGIAGVVLLGKQGTAAAAADCMSCRIGNAADMMANGIISFANAPAARIGVVPGMTVSSAATRLAGADPASIMADTPQEARWDTSIGGMTILFVDSASLVNPDDEGRIIITGSHGGLIGGDPKRALKARARLAVFNDAGMGKDNVGMTRLPALDQAGVAALTVSHNSARIGDAQSAFDTGLISAANEVATRLGCIVGEPLREALARLT